MAFTPQLTPPKKGDKYYNNAKGKGYSTNILGNYPYGVDKTKRTGLPGLNVLPNCCGWASGRFASLSGKNKLLYDFNTDAKNFIALAKQYGLETGITPRLGAIIVWSNGTSNPGHVGVCEKIISSTEIVISQSGWNYKGSTGMWTATHKKGLSGNWVEGDDYSWMGNNYKFLGFVYHPDIEEGIYPLSNLRVSYLNNTCTVKAINKKDFNYVRLRDIEDELHLCGIGFFNNKVTLNGEYLDLSNLDIIKQDNTNYVKLKDLETKLKICKVDYNSATQTITITPK